ncbi:MAG: malonic semialdehyde reductase, partial [Polymorphobacter sp.]
MPGSPLPDSALDLLFREARTYNSWSDAPVTEADIRALYDLVKMGPTSANCSPARFVFCVTDAARQRLAALVLPSNRDKILDAPVTVIIGMDQQFHERLPELFPHADARSWFAGNDALRLETAFRNSSLQGAYLMLAARALGFDCGPMSGFDKAGVNAAFFAGTDNEANFICTLGKGTAEKL